jgi:hypothetical protein
MLSIHKHDCRVHRLSFQKESQVSLNIGTMDSAKILHRSHTLQNAKENRERNISRLGFRQFQDLLVPILRCCHTVAYLVVRPLETPYIGRFSKFKF